MSAQIETHDLPGDFGAVEVLGVTPEVAILGEEIRSALRTALARSAVLCLRQPEGLDDDGLRAIAEVFGPIKDPVAATKAGGTIRYSEERQVVDAGFVLTEELRAELGDLSFGGLDAQRPGLFETFHTDDSYTERPAITTVLHAASFLVVEEVQPGSLTCAPPTAHSTRRCADALWGCEH